MHESPRPAALGGGEAGGELRGFDGAGLWDDLDVDGESVLIEVDGARVGGGAHRGLGVEDDLARRAGRSRGQGEGGGDRILGHLEGQAVPHRGLGVEAHAEQQPSAGGLRTDGALQHPRRATAGMDAELLEARIENRCRTGDSDVGGQGEVESGADGGAVDRGDRRQRALGDGEEPVVDHAQTVLGGGAEGGEVGTGAERLSGAGHDDGVDAGIGLGGLDRGTQCGRTLGRHGVAAVGVVDGDEGDAVGDLRQNGIGHVPEPSDPMRRRFSRSERHDNPIPRSVTGRPRYGLPADCHGPSTPSQRIDKRRYCLTGK